MLTVGERITGGEARQEWICHDWNSESWKGWAGMVAIGDVRSFADWPQVAGMA